MRAPSASVSSGPSIPARFAPRLLLLAALAPVACAKPSPPPAPEVVRQAREAGSYSARLKASVRGPQGRGSLRLLLAFRRPDALRIEVPGPTGARLIAVARAGALVALFPGEAAAYEGRATAEELDALLGVALTPAEIMDLLVGAPAPRLRAYQARWGKSLPREVRATLPDGTRLKVVAEEAQAGAALPEAAFAAPRREGYRLVDVDEARELWTGRRRRPRS